MGVKCFFFSSRRRHTRYWRDWSSDVCSSDLELAQALTFFPREFHFDGRGVSLASRLRSPGARSEALATAARSLAGRGFFRIRGEALDRKSTRLNSSHANISYAVFCLKKKNTSLILQSVHPRS